VPRSRYRKATSQAYAVGTPAIPKLARIESAVGVEAREARGIVGRVDVLLGRCGVVVLGADAVGGPLVKIVARGSVRRDVEILWIVGLHGEGLALVQQGRALLAQDVDAALQNIDAAAVVEIVETEAGMAVGFDAEVAAGDAEVVAVAGIDGEGRGALAQDEARGLGAVFEREIEELKNGVFTDQRERAVFEFNFGEAVFGGDDEALANREIELGVLPRDVLGAGKRVAFDVAGETHVSLDVADANNSDMTGVGRSGRSAGESEEAEREQTD